MITEDYVSFETAKLLKEKGFDEATHQFYKAITYLGTEANSICIKSLDGIEDEPFHNSVYGVDLNGEDTGEYACPTLQMVMKWLRVVYNLEIYPYHNSPNNRHNSEWWFEIIKYPNSVAEYECGMDEEVDTYEEACEAAIKYCLENLI
jgi:hypothetical protein